MGVGFGTALRESSDPSAATSKENSVETKLAATYSLRPTGSYAKPLAPETSRATTLVSNVPGALSRTRIKKPPRVSLA
jgi:hypothetical protein